MTRILCLHGHGTSSKIFEGQLAGMKQFLPDDYELVFADGEIECTRAPGIPQAVPGPFLCYFDSFSFDALSAAHELLQVIIEEEGPFDGIFAFSQGASLTLSYLLELERQDPGNNPPIKFAILFSPSVALSPDRNFSVDIVESLDVQDFNTLANVVGEFSGLRKELLSSTLRQQAAQFEQVSSYEYEPDDAKRKSVFLSGIEGIIRSGLQTEFLNSALLQTFISQQDTSIVPRPYHPALLAQRVRIPTVHITGSKDHVDVQSQCKVMPLLCRKDAVKTLVHGGGHDLPRTSSDIKKVVAAIEWAVQESRMPLF